MQPCTIFNQEGPVKDIVRSLKDERIEEFTLEKLHDMIKENHASLGSILDGIAGEQCFVNSIKESPEKFLDCGKPPERGKTSKIDRYIQYLPTGNIHTIQVKELTAASIKKMADNNATGRCSLKMTDKQKIVLPSTGKSFVTTHSLRNHFQVLATSLFPFTGITTDFAFMLNRDLTIPTNSNSRSLIKQQLIPIEFRDLLTQSQKLFYPLPKNGCWTRDLASLLEECDNLTDTRGFKNYQTALMPNTAEDIFT